jgi:hypothetical protein
VCQQSCIELIPLYYSQISLTTTHLESDGPGDEEDGVDDKDDGYGEQEREVLRPVVQGQVTELHLTTEHGANYFYPRIETSAYI